MAARLIELASAADADAIAAVRNAAADDLTRRFGEGHWSAQTSVKDVARSIANPHQRVLVARRRGKVVGTLILQTKKPWSIDVAYFSRAERPIYLVNMAVDPRVQGQGIGRRLIAKAIAVAQEWGGDAVRLDAYDADAGAGGFYSACGFRETKRASYKGTPHVYFELGLATSRNDGEPQRTQRGGGRRGSARK